MWSLATRDLKMPMRVPIGSCVHFHSWSERPGSHSDEPVIATHLYSRRHRFTSLTAKLSLDRIHLSRGAAVPRVWQTKYGTRTLRFGIKTFFCDVFHFRLPAFPENGSKRTNSHGGGEPKCPIYPTRPSPLFSFLSQDENIPSGESPPGPW